MPDRANAQSAGRRFAFVTALTLREEEPETINDSEAIDKK